MDEAKNILDTTDVKWAKCVFKDVDGQHYIFYGSWRHCNIGKLNEGFSGFVPFENDETFKEITPEHNVERPFMFRKNGKYYFIWSEGEWAGPDYSAVYAIVELPVGPFERVGKILQQDPGVVTGAGYHSVFKIPNEEKYFSLWSIPARPSRSRQYLGRFGK